MTSVIACYRDWLLFKSFFEMLRRGRGYICIFILEKEDYIPLELHSKKVAIEESPGNISTISHTIQLSYSLYLISTNM